MKMVLNIIEVDGKVKLTLGAAGAGCERIKKKKKGESGRGETEERACARRVLVTMRTR